MRPSEEAAGGLLVGLAALLFGGVVVLGKIVENSDLPVPSFLSIRFGLAALLLAGVLAATRQPLVAAPAERWPLAALGMAGYAVESALFFAALRHGGAAAVTLLFFTYPVLVALIAIFTGKGLPGWLLGGSLLAAVGGAALVVVSSGGLDITTAGIVLAFASALAFARASSPEEQPATVTTSMAAAK